jgi:hypothetical protein
MAMDPEFFTPRHSGQAFADPALELARRAALAAVELALAPEPERIRRAETALRLLRAVCFEADATELVGLDFPLDDEGMRRCLDAPLRRWLPFAATLGIAEERLQLLGWPTAACRELRARLA